MLGVSWAWLAGVVVAMFAYVLKHRANLELNGAEVEIASTYVWFFRILRLSSIAAIVITASVPGK